MIPPPSLPRCPDKPRRFARQSSLWPAPVSADSRQLFYYGCFSSRKPFTGPLQGIRIPTFVEAKQVYERRGCANGGSKAVQRGGSHEMVKRPGNTTALIAAAKIQWRCRVVRNAYLLGGGEMAMRSKRKRSQTTAYMLGILDDNIFVFR